jgi:hypothetical protein
MLSCCFTEGKISYRCRESAHDSLVVNSRSLIVTPTNATFNMFAYEFDIAVFPEGLAAE